MARLQALEKLNFSDSLVGSNSRVSSRWPGRTRMRVHGVHLPRPWPWRSDSLRVSQVPRCPKMSVLSHSTPRLGSNGLTVFRLEIVAFKLHSRLGEAWPNPIVGKSKTHLPSSTIIISSLYHHYTIIIHHYTIIIPSSTIMIPSSTIIIPSLYHHYTIIIPS